jgi:hypothetical protein
VSSAARLGGTAAVALAIVCGVGLGACGEDDETATAPAGATGVAGETETTGESATTTTTTSAEEQPADQGSGGTEPPLVSDEGHEGGGPDPGTEEYEEAEENATGGVGADQPQGAGQPQGGSGGQSPPDAFEQFCEQNPRACE